MGDVFIPQQHLLHTDSLRYLKYENRDYVKLQFMNLRFIKGFREVLDLPAQEQLLTVISALPPFPSLSSFDLMCIK